MHPSAPLHALAQRFVKTVFICGSFPTRACPIGGPALLELLITCLIPLDWFHRFAFVAACLDCLSTKDHYFHFQRPLHDMTSKEMAIPMRPACNRRRRGKTPVLSPAVTTELWHQGAPLDRRALLKSRRSSKSFFTWWEWGEGCVPQECNEPDLMAFQCLVAWRERVYQKISNKNAVYSAPQGRCCCDWRSLFRACGDLLWFSRSGGPASRMSWQKITQGNKVSRLSLVCAYFKGSLHQKLQITLLLEWIQIHWFPKTCTCLKILSSHASPQSKNIAFIKVPMHNSEYIWRK